MHSLLDVLAVLLPFFLGLIGCAAFGAKVGSWLFVRPDKRHPLKPHAARDTLAVVGGAALFAAIWIYGSVIWFAPHPK